MRVSILGVEVDQVTFQTALDQIESFVHQKGSHQVVTVNPEFVMRAQTDRAFARVLRQADLAVPDGAGLLWASRILERRQKSRGGRARHSLILPERVTGTDLVPALAALSAANGWRVYLLGGLPGMAKEAGVTLKRVHPGLKIVGAECGPRIGDDGKAINANQEALLGAVIQRIKQAKPHILFVGFGAPKQDRFIARYKDELNVPVMIGVGGAYEFIAGRVQRAPALFRALWFEWLWRFFRQPWRAARIWTAVGRFSLKILFGK